MDPLILHHFAASPFSEKLRLVLGYKRLAWKSVLVPAVMPKPDIVALTGGYRRTPVLQIGADIYCDTALICDVLERLQPAPSLYPEPLGALSRVVGQWADSSLFWAAVRHNRGPMGSGLSVGGTAQQARALFEDRKAMGLDLEWPRPADATAPYGNYLQQLSGMLGSKKFLLGELPTLADFCAFHPLWLAQLRAPPALDLLAPWPGLRGWLVRMQEIGHGQMSDCDAAQALEMARRATPVAIGSRLLPDGGFQNHHGIALGSRVHICAESFGTEPSEGFLVAASASHYSLRHENPRAGAVHVHFPRVGYVLRHAAAGAATATPDPDSLNEPERNLMETHHKRPGAFSSAAVPRPANRTTS